MIDSTPSASASCFWVRPALRRAVRSRPPHFAAVVGTQANGPHTTLSDRLRRWSAVRPLPIPQPNPLSTALATLIALGEEEGPPSAGQTMAKDSAAELHSEGPTLTSIFPMFSPRSNPTKAWGAFSIPSITVSR